MVKTRLGNLVKAGLCVGCLLVMTAPLAASTYSIYNIGKDAQDNEGAVGINNSTQVAGFRSDYFERGWVWQEDAAGNYLPNPWGGTGHVFTQAINEDGVVAGYSRPYDGGAGDTEAAIWMPDGSGGYTGHNLGTVSGYDRGYAYGMNESGKVVGGAYDSTWKGSLWEYDNSGNRVGAWRVLAGYDGKCWDINNNGIIAARRFDNGPVVLEPNTSDPTDYNDYDQTVLPGASSDGRAFKINDNGTIVGSDGTDAVLWEKVSGTWTMTTTLPDLNDAGGTARGINETGDIIVGTSDSKAVKWTLEGGSWSVTDLNTLSFDGGSDSFDSLDYATGVNDSGHISVSGTAGSYDQGFVIVPEPATMILLLVGGLAGTIRRNK